MKETTKSELCPLLEEEALASVSLLKLLANPIRLGILSLLSQREELRVSTLVDCLPTDQSNLSHHLLLLRYGGLVDCRRDGTQVYYRVQREALGTAWGTMNALIQSWIDGIDPL